MTPRPRDRRGIPARLRDLRGDETGGALASSLITVAVTLVLVTGLVVDSAGKYQAAERAQAAAESAARAATTAVAPETLLAGQVSIDPVRAGQVASEFLAAAEVTGEVEVIGTTVHVRAETPYETRFLSLIGIPELTGHGEATATLLTEEEP